MSAAFSHHIRKIRRKRPSRDPPDEHERSSKPTAEPPFVIANCAYERPLLGRFPASNHESIFQSSL